MTYEQKVIARAIGFVVTVSVGAVIAFVIARRRKKQEVPPVEEVAKDDEDEMARIFEGIQKRYLDEYGNRLEDSENIHEIFTFIVDHTDKDADWIYQNIFHEQKEDEILEYTEEDTLRHDINSAEAFAQYTDMQLSELTDEHTLDVMRMLMDYQIDLENSGDDIGEMAIISWREEFFTPESTFTTWISFGELLLYFAQQADYEFDGGIEPYIEDWLEKSGLSDCRTRVELYDQVDTLTHRLHSTDETFGLFGIDVGDIRESVPSDFRGEFEIWKKEMVNLI